MTLSPVAQAVKDIFDDPNTGDDAVWYPRHGDPVDPVRVILARADEETGLFDTGSVAAATQVEVQVADIECPHEGDRVEITSGDASGEVFTVKKKLRSRKRLVWKCSVRKV